MFCLGLCSPVGAVRDGVFFDVEANFRLRWLRRGLRRMQKVECGMQNFTVARKAERILTNARMT
jgi:hypothetical protein